MDSPRFNRRSFLHPALAGSAVSGLNAAPDSDAAEFDEPAQKLALNDDADVIVCGAGPAGVTAAIAAARAGAKMQLFEVHGCLGGVWEGLQIAATAEQIGVRDGRRIHGRYTMTRQGLIQGARQKRCRGPCDLRCGHPRGLERDEPKEADQQR